MRIITGKFNRRKLLTNPGNTTRPITDRVKVILFDRLENLCRGARVADIFAGTGSMGLEALSRGSLTAVFIERDHRAYSLLVQNVNTIGAAPQSVCWRTDALRSSYRPKGVDGFLPYDLIFFDPPYSMVDEIRPGRPVYKALERLAGDQVAAAGARLVYRCAHGASFQFPPAWQCAQQFQVNSMDLYVFQKGSEPDATAPIDAPAPAPPELAPPDKPERSGPVSE